MSLYLPELNAVFVAIPKTGSQWVRRVLAESGATCAPAGGPGDHNLPGTYGRGGPGEPTGNRRFCFVRHPLEWYESVWRGLHSSWPDRRPVKPLHRERTWSPIRLVTYTAGARTFDEFVRAVLSEQPGFWSRMCEWYAGPPGAPAVDYVGRCENLADDLRIILTALGWKRRPAETPRVNESETPAPVWNPELRERVLESERVGVNRWYTSAGPFRVTTE